MRGKRRSGLADILESLKKMKLCRIAQFSRFGKELRVS